MLVTVVITLCSLSVPGECMDISPFDPIPAWTCAVGAPAAIQWSLENHPGYHLLAWKCVPGTPAVRS